MTTKTRKKTPYRPAMKDRFITLVRRDMATGVTRETSIFVALHTNGYTPVSIPRHNSERIRVRLRKCGHEVELYLYGLLQRDARYTSKCPTCFEDDAREGARRRNETFVRYVSATEIHTTIDKCGHAAVRSRTQLQAAHPRVAVCSVCASCGSAADKGLPGCTRDL